MAKDPSRTERATPKRVRKARGEGNVAKSRELNKAIVLLVGLLVMRGIIGDIGDELRGLFIWFLGEGQAYELTPNSVYDLFLLISQKIAAMLLPLLLSIALAAFVINRIQVGKLWSPKVFKPKFAQMFNIVAGLKRMMISTRTLINLGKNFIMGAIVGVAPYIILKRETPNLLPLFYQSVEGIASYILSSAYTMVLYTLVPMFLIAAVDTWYSFWKYREDLKMTKNEVKDEARQAEGDPVVRQQQKKKMFAVMQQRMMKKVPEADVIITNPTHYAVALQYNPDVAPAPLVVAKGVDRMALRIREIAREHRVPIRENRALARALYDQVEVGEIIPENMYKAVATILAKLHKLRKQRPPR